MDESIKTYQLQSATSSQNGYSKLEDATLRMMPLAYEMIKEGSKAGPHPGLTAKNLQEMIAAYARSLAIAALDCANENL